MAHRVVATLTVLHRGVPLGRTSLVELDALEPHRVPPHPAAGDPTDPSFAINGFEPLPHYDGVRPIVRRASEAARNFGYLGLVADPNSDLRGRAALAALQELIAELEFRDVTGRIFPVDIVAFDESPSVGETTSVTLGGIVEHSAVPLLARLPVPHPSDSGHQAPAV